MSEVTSSIEEPIVRVSQFDMKYRQPRSTPPSGMVWLAILAGMLVLGACENTANEFNGMASELPVEQITTDIPPPREAVTDLYSVPLAAFKVQVPQIPQLAEGDEAELLGLPLGKAENNTDTSSNPPFSNLWFNAGQSLGSAANSLTGWLNNRLAPQTTSTTTKPPEVIVRVQSQQVKKKPLISIDATDGSRRKSQANRIGPAVFDTDDDVDDDDEDVDDEDEYDDADEGQVDETDSNSNRYSTNNDEEESDDSDANVYEDEEDEEEEENPSKKRRGNKNKQTRLRPINNRRDYEYEEEEDGDEYDDDEDYDYDLPNKNIGRQQQKQSLFNRFRQLAKMPYSSGNKQKNDGIQSQKPGYRPVRIVQNGQVLQFIQDRPSNQQQQQQQQQQKRRRRPAANSDTSFQLIPIPNNQVSNAGQKQKRKNINRPDQANQFVIPIPQSSQNNQKRPNQFITIPWSQLGISNQQKDSQPTSPIIVNIPQYALQQNSNRRRRPALQPSQAAPQRARRPLNNGQVISLLTDQNVRDIFRVPEIPPSRTPQRPVAQSDNATTNKPATSPQPEVDIQDDEDENHDHQEPYIVVGDDDTEVETLARQAMPKRFLHIGGMKPYADVLNKGRIYFKSGRLMRMDFDDRPESDIVSVNPQHMVHITTESLSKTKANAQPKISTKDISISGHPLSQ